jgi:peptidoglycan/LPS O-acetylase OafA/YrhL
MEIKLPRARQIGAITYPLYLLHQTIGYVILKHFANEQNKLLMIPATMLIMIAFAYLLHRIVEVKMRGFWRKLFDVVIARPIQFLEEQLLRLKAKLRIAV